MNKKTLMITTVALLGILTISMIGTAYAFWWRWWRPKPKVLLRFDQDIWNVPGTGTREYYRDKVKTYGAESTGTVNLTILQWLPVDPQPTDPTEDTHEPAPSVIGWGITHTYLNGEMEGTVSLYADRYTFEGTWYATFTCTFNNAEHGVDGTFVIKMKCDGLGLIHASEWYGYGTGDFEGITASGISVAPNIGANLMGLPNEKTTFGLVQRGYYNLPPRNIPETSPP